MKKSKLFVLSPLQKLQIAQDWNLNISVKGKASRDVKPKRVYQEIWLKVSEYLGIFDKWKMCQINRSFAREFSQPTHYKAIDFKTVPVPIPPNRILMQLTLISQELKYLNLPPYLKYSDYKKYDFDLIPIVFFSACLKDLKR